MDVMQKWQNALLSVDSTIEEAIHNLNQSTLQIIMVIDQDDKLLGTITDGDIRRGLLRGMTLNSKIDSVINYNALVAPQNMSRELVLTLLKSNKIHQLPIVDSGHHVIGLHLLDDLSQPHRRDNLMVVMAGGLGSRLKPYTENCPKPLLLVAGKPILEHIICRAKDDGFQNFKIAVHYLGHMIEDYFRNGELWQLNIEYIKEKFPLGTAGALKLISPKPTNAFLVSNGDILTDISYGKLLDYHMHHNAIATMAVRQHEWTHPFGVVQTKGLNIISFEEKPVTRTYVNAGIYVLDPKALDFLLMDEPCDMPTLFDRLRQNGLNTVVYPIHEPWSDIGEPHAFSLANMTY